MPVGWLFDYRVWARWLIGKLTLLLTCRRHQTSSRLAHLTSNRAGRRCSLDSASTVMTTLPGHRSAVLRNCHFDCKAVYFTTEILAQILYYRSLRHERKCVGCLRSGAGRGNWIRSSRNVRSSRTNPGRIECHAQAQSRRRILVPVDNVDRTGSGAAPLCVFFSPSTRGLRCREVLSP